MKNQVTLTGLGGNETLIGQGGADSLSGGSGIDVFAYGVGDSTAAASDIIHDFETTIDKIDLRGGRNRVLRLASHSQWQADHPV